VAVIFPTYEYVWFQFVRKLVAEGIVSTEFIEGRPQYLTWTSTILWKLFL